VKTYTPGPWHFTRDGTGFAIFDATGFPILRVRGGVMPRLVDATLMTAAPELLEALQVVEHYGISGLDGDAHAALEDMLPIIQAAIAKAKEVQS
jgi:hypothetical protein